MTNAHRTAAMALGMVAALLAPGGARAAEEEKPGAEAGETASQKAPDDGDEPTRGSSPWVVDANIGVLKLKSDELRFAGDATLGYATRRLGLVADGFVSAYDIKKPTLISDYLRTGGGGEFWYLTTGRDRGLHLELRASGSGLLYSSDSNLLDRREFISETSVFGRGSALLGLKFDPDDTFFLELILGAGFQYEWYNRDNALGSSLEFTSVDKEQATFRGDGRLVVRWRFWPGRLAGRVRAKGQTFTLNRTTETLIATAATQSTTIASEVTEFRQTEVAAKIFLDLEAVSFGGLTPVAFAGLDYFGISGTAGSVSTLVPSAGVGLFRDVQ